MAILSMFLKRRDLKRSATPTTTPAISAPRMAFDSPLKEGSAGSTHIAFARSIAEGMAVMRGGGEVEREWIRPFTQVEKERQLEQYARRGGNNRKETSC